LLAISCGKETIESRVDSYRVIVIRKKRYEWLGDRGLIKIEEK
jgi:hypothetical protein